MQGKLLGDLVKHGGKALQLALERSQVRQASSQAVRQLSTTTFLNPRDLKPLPKKEASDSKEASDLPSSSLGKLKKEIYIDPDGRPLLVKAPGQANPKLEGGKNTTVRAKESTHVYNPLSRSEALNGKIMKESLKPHQSDIIVKTASKRYYRCRCCISC